ncbi:CDP-diacylglycerol--glycerol-3-phosphate 3-phosphatidyltransferase [Clostridium sp. SYSU_GA19001]|uniref:CDP-diacylglycerol--glycerol-3-phosphate 3-phosphatidyltransferase n=1 Tax=Clostridium caldaquaticum TaxID=2940653 RepID=UPI002077648B|nr:CDP-diacylglycerol--glycerol-3-phosphate 3-phosphatidyltransferase [Clostridium caldaquaticum]MCM8711411.1 CDP-diacylglycerol--glycerol-3-phosphate 3-phosphatidyltransferase [Clostridium caldaquaticum]
MNIPNILTIFRLLLIPAFVIVFKNSPSNNNLALSTIVFLIAGFTDFLDGYIARKYNLVTKIGIVLDPLADKLMLMTVLTCLVIKSYIPLWILIVIACKEIFMIFCGVFLYKKGTVIPSNKLGKLSTIFFYVSIVILVFNKTAGKFLLYFSVASALIALVNYTFVYKKGKKDDDKNIYLNNNREYL